jgi:2'-5' RNA ligase
MFLLCSSSTESLQQELAMTDQRRNRRRASNPLYLMAKPSDDVRAYVIATGRVDPFRDAGLLHTTIQPLCDLAMLPPGVEAWVAEQLSGVYLPPLRLVFDRIVESARTVSLRCSQPSEGAAAFRTAIVSALVERGFPVPPYRFVPHITIAYHRDGLGTEAIIPIEWHVEEVLLVESVVGQARHVVHGRWRLGARLPCA